MGDYHPHGDSAIDDAMAAMVNTTTSPIEGSGAWGTITDRPAASRYIECRLSAWGWNNFFDSAYAKNVPMMPNYDGSNTEPVCLASNTLNLLVNGTFGIAVAATCNIPAFTAKSVNKVLQFAIAGKLTPALAAKHLEFDSKYGGVVLDTPANRAAKLQLCKDGVATIEFSPVYTVKGNVITLTGFPALLRTGSVAAGVAALDVVDLWEDISDIKTGHVFRVTLKRLPKAALDAGIEAVIKKFRVRNSYKISYLTENLEVDDNTDVEFTSTGIVEMVETWLVWRREAETLRIQNEIVDLKHALNKLAMQMLAHTKRKVLDDCRDKPDPGAYLKKTLKVDDETVSYLLGLTVRQLTGLAKKDLLSEKTRLAKRVVDRTKDLKRIDPILTEIFKGK